VVLGVGQLQVFGADLGGHLDDAVEVVDVGRWSTQLITVG
jgi:hypothetical protein